MVDPLLFTGFLAATALLVLSPGPIVSMIIAETLGRSSRHGLAVALGAGLVLVLFQIIYIAGFSAVLMALPDWGFTAIRYGGVILLAHMAIQMLRSKGNVSIGDAPDKTPAQAFRHAMLLSATNPKAILFFAAFYPQFISRDLPVTPQLIVMGFGFLIVAVGGDCTWVAASSYARTWLVKKGGARFVTRLAGGVLLCGALLLLLVNPA